jgi:RNA polymerase sigma-70 factor (ECF subfamily)
VSVSDVTCWSLIRGAAEGNLPDREAFALRYARVIRSYLGARWRGTPLTSEIDDAAQEVFLDCFRDGGALEKARPGERRAFRAFLYGVVRNVAHRLERKRARAGMALASDLEVPGREEALSVVFDRAWATALLRQAAALHAARAPAAGPTGRKRVDLLHLRFQEGLPIRDIARLWDVDPAWVHHQYATARKEFRDALRDVVKEHNAGSDGEVERECERLIGCFR